MKNLSYHFKDSRYKSIPKKMKSELIDDLLKVFQQYGDMIVHCIVDCNGKIDENRLKQAVRLSFDAEPVLGCFRVERFFSPFWQRCPDFDQYEYCSVINTEETEKETQRFLVISAPFLNGPRIQVRIIRSREGDRLIVKIDHMVADAAGLKQYVYLLTSLYKKLKNNPEYTPLPNLKGSRSMHQVFFRFSVLEKLKIFFDGQLTILRWIFPRKSFSFPTSGNERTYIFKSISGEQFDRLKEYSQSQGSTLNDVVLAALYRTFFKVINPVPGTPLRLITTADLRRYLPESKAEAICNLSAFVYLNIGTYLGDSFEETLQLVKSNMNAFKQNYIGLGDYPHILYTASCFPFAVGKVLFTRMMDIAYQKNSAPIGITNMGCLDTEKLDFGKPKVTGAFTVASVIYPPAFVLGLSGYQDSLTFSLGYCRTSDESNAEDFFEILKDTLLCLGRTQK